MNDMNGLLMEIVHLASAAIVTDETEVKRQALADIADAIAAIVPVEGRKIGGEDAAETGRGNPDYKKYILSTHAELARTVAEQKEVK